MPDYIIAIDQGTTSTRAIIFDRAGLPRAIGQKPHRQYFPEAGWVEHDPLEIWQNTQEVIGTTLGKAGLTRHDIAAIGITNQRETTVVWDRHTGQPIYPAIVWQDTRTQPRIDQLAAEAGDLGTQRFAAATGLPLASYFSASKIAWILDHVPGARERATAGDVLFGTTDCWLLWNLTGGPAGGVHATDVTNASRTLLMDLQTLCWRDDLLEAFGVPRAMLPEIRSSAETFGYAESSSLLAGTAIAGMLGDQQSATFGQAAFRAGESKNTYGTGCFLMFQTGEQIVPATNGLLSTVAYKLGEAPANYALEGSVAVAGALVQWLRDQLGIIRNSADVEALARSVPDTGDCYIVPAFSGLFAPYWRPDARGTITGMTRYTSRAHLARAALEAVAFQTRDVLDAVNTAVQAAGGPPLRELRVDGGMVVNDTLMQIQADLLGVPVVRPRVVETTALGAAYAAGLATGFWSGIEELRSNWGEDQRWEPHIEADAREARVARWRQAVDRSLGWAA